MSAVGTMTRCARSTKRTRLLYAMTAKWKAKVLRELLPLPGVLCLGYIFGVTLPFLSTVVQILGAGILLWWLSPRRLSWWLLVGLCMGIGGIQGYHALFQAEMVMRKGQEIVGQGSVSLFLVVDVASEEAGGGILWTGYLTDQPLRLRVESSTDPELLPGDLVRVEGRMIPLRLEEDAVFHYPLYLAKNGIGGRLRAETVEILRRGGESPLRFLAWVRRHSLQRLAELWPGDVGALMAGILIGARGSFSEQLENNMRQTGLMHIVAVSGFNMTILISTVLHCTKRWKFGVQVVLASLVLVLFTLLVGPSGAVVRACLMGIIALFARLAGRPSQVFVCLLYAATLMLWISPLDATLDIGFQLSFCAVLGLLWGEPLTSRMLAPLPDAIRRELATTLAAIFWTLPLSVVYFSSLSLIAPLANLLIPPSIPYLMFGGFLSFLLSFVPVFQVLTAVLAPLLYLWVQALLWVAHLLAHIPYAAISLELPTAWRGFFLTGCYGVLSYLAYRHWRHCQMSDAKTSPAHLPAPPQGSQKMVWPQSPGVRQSGP